MKSRKLILIKVLTIGFQFLFIYGSFIPTAIAKTKTDSTYFSTAETPTLVLNSFSFNAKKKSNFLVEGQIEQIGRGLTIIHFNTSTKFEYKTFDTYSSEEASKKMVNVLLNLQKNNAIFAILAHDSAAKNLLKQATKLTKMGFVQLSNLKGRQAYIMHNIGGDIYENIDDTSVTIALDISENIMDNQVYFPKTKHKFEPNNNRYIAHAGGEVDGHKSTNTKTALDQNYEKGFRLFELDIIETSDGKLVAAHDWNMWARFTDYTGTLPPTHEEFMKETIYGDYITMDMEGINDWFRSHPDATLVTDKLNDPIAFANAFVDKNRLIMELFSEMTVEDASKVGLNAMISQKPFMGIVGDKVNYLLVNNIKYVALSRRLIVKHAKLLLQLKEAGIKVYVYHVNFNEGKDEIYVQENEIGLVYGMYADKWAFD